MQNCKAFENKNSHILSGQSTVYTYIDVNIRVQLYKLVGKTEASSLSGLAELFGYKVNMPAVVQEQQQKKKRT